MKGKGKGGEFYTLHKPLPLVKGKKGRTHSKKYSISMYNLVKPACNTCGSV